jgi:hypothetical protein
VSAPRPVPDLYELHRQATREDLRQLGLILAILIVATAIAILIGRIL